MTRLLFFQPHLLLLKVWCHEFCNCNRTMSHEKGRWWLERCGGARSLKLSSSSASFGSARRSSPTSGVAREGGAKFTGKPSLSQFFHQSWSGERGSVPCARQQLYRINKVMSPCFISPIVSLYCAVVRRLAGAPVIYRGTWRMQPAPLGAPRGTPATTPAPHPARLLYQLHVLMDYFGISIVFAVVACYVYCAAVRADWVFAVSVRAPSVNCIRNARTAAQEFPKMIVFAVTSAMKFETDRRRVESQIVPTYRITGGLRRTFKKRKRS